MKKTLSILSKWQLLLVALFMCTHLGAQFTPVFTVGQASSADVGQGSKYQALIRVTLRLDTREKIQKMSFVLTGKENIQSLQLYSANGNDATFRHWFLPMANAITAFPSDTVTFITNGPAVYNLNTGGDQNFYLVMEVKTDATIDALIDARCIGTTIANLDLVPANGNPTGARKVVAPLSGTYTIQGTVGPTNFTSFAAAITALNNQGSKDGVTFLLPDDSVIVNTATTAYIYQTGSPTNVITFKRSGTGIAKPILRTTGTGSGDDATFTFWGSDYVVIDGLSIDCPSSGANGVEYGIRLRNARDDGSKNMTIQNCDIALDSTKDSRGIFANRNVQLISADGNNDKLRIINNTIRQARRAIFLDYGNLSNYLEDSVWIEGNVISSIAIENANAAIYTRDIKNLFIRNNEIKDIRSGTNFNTFRGMEVAAINLYLIGNKVHGITNPGKTTASRVYGILAYGQNNYIINNMIWDINVTDTSAVAAGGEVIRGISIEGYNNIGYCYVYNNTVVLKSVTNPTIAQWAQALYVQNNVTWCELKNNIAISQCTGLAKNIPLIFNIDPLRIYSKESNNNLFYSGTPSASNIIARVNGTDRQTLLAYKQNLFGYDLNSTSDNVPFVGVDDVHINNSIATSVEGKGIAVAMVTTDIDGDPRDPSNPDIGADEGVFIASVDTLGPKIVHVPMQNTPVATAPTLVFEITDPQGDGVDTTVNKPRVYYRKVQNTNAFSSTDNTSTFNGWKWVEPTNNSSPFSFTLDWTKLNGGAPLSDGSNNSLIEYFIVAQDYHVNPNLTVYPPNGTYTATTVSNISAITIGNRYRYRILNPVAYSGDYLVGVGDGEPFATLVAAATALNNGYISGSVRLLLNDVSYSHAANTVTFNQIIGASATNTITIKPAPGVKPLIQYTPTGNNAAAIVLNGADYFTIDGSNTDGGSTQDLTIQTTATSYSGAVVNLRPVYNTTDGTINSANNNVIKNCNILGPNASTLTADLAGITSGGAPRGTGDFNDTLTIENNFIKNVRYGIEVRGNQTGIFKKLSIVNNTLDSLFRNGIDVERVKDVTITGNVLKNIESANSAGDYYGIYLRTNVTDAVISNNIIDKVTNSSANRWNAGILIEAGVVNANILVSNNMISNILSYNSHGIRINSAGNSSNIMVLHNTINLTGNADAYSADANTVHACIRYGSLRDAVIQNNILNMSILTSEPKTPVATLRTYKTYNTFVDNNATVSNIDMNYNAYWNSNPGVAVKAYAASYLNNDRLTLKDFQLLNGFDLNSVSDSVKFISANDLSIDATKPTKIDGAGIPSVVTTDIDGDARDASTPDIGADEGAFIPAASVLKAVLSVIPYNVPIFNPSATILLQAKDLAGNDVAVGGEKVTFVVKDLTGYCLGTIGATYDSLNGRYTAPLTVTRMGKPALVYAYMGGQLVSDTAMFNVYNNTPTDLAISKSKINEMAPAGTFIAKLTSTDVDQAQGDKYTYSLVTGTGSTDNASFTISNDSLFVGASALAGYATKALYAIRVRTTDLGSVYYEEALTITLNAAPTNITITPSVINDSTAKGSVIATLAATDPNGGSEVLTFTLVAGEGDTNNVSMTITGNQITADSMFVYALTKFIYLRVQVEDQDTMKFVKQLVIGINTKPTDIMIAKQTVNEASPKFSIVGALTGTDPNLQNLTYSLPAGQLDNASFSLSGANLVTNEIFDFETKTSYNVRIRGTDPGGLFIEEDFAITILDVYESATDVTLTFSEVEENKPTDTFVGEFASVDQDAGDAHTYTLVSGTGNTDNAKFKIFGDSLLTNASFDYETQKTASIRVRSRDKGNKTYDKVITITITDVEEVALYSATEVIDVYPVPTNGILNIRNKTLPIGSILSIVDLNGRLVATYVLTSDLMALNLGNLSKGMYMLRITNDEKVYSTNFVIE